MTTSCGPKPSTWSTCRALALALCAGAAAAGGEALAQQAGERVVVDAPADRDLYLAGGAVEVPAEVAGDVVAAGGTVTTSGAIGEDLAAAGGTIQVRGRVGDDVRGVGGEITLGANVEDAAVLAGGSVRIARGVQVGGQALIAAGTVSLDGDVGGELRVVGGRVRIGGSVAGNATIEARDRLELVPGARFGGDLVYASPAPVALPEGVTVAGRVVHRPLEGSGGGAGGAAAVLGVVWTLGLALAAVILLVAFPRLTVAAARLVPSSPGRVLLTGAIAVSAVPIVTVAVLLTGVGAPLALAVLGIWLVALFAGWLVAAVFLADVAARRLLKREPGLGARAGLAALAAVVLALVGAIPLLGWLVALSALLFGTGALLLALGRALRAGPAQVATARNR
ncbi:MAG TPA: hypothetical protein VEB43_18180 [Anaeromyxobacter sp.]|nr:hypothetical protein [Anaeromyxobacter sp.]